MTSAIFVFGVDEERLHHQVIGPRVPRSWFRDLEHEAMDETESFDAWHSSNSSVNPQEFCQLVSGVIMGDRNAVYANESVHRRQLIDGVAVSVCIGDVYIDNLVLICLTHFSLKTLAETTERMHAADEFYRGVGMPVSEIKSGERTVRDVWGGELDGVRGTLGFSLGRRVSFMLTTVVGSVAGLTGLHLQQLLGIWTFALTFRREELSVLDVAFVAAAAFPPKRRCSITGPLLDELLVATFLGPLLTANLRAPPHLSLFATDASLSGAGACSSTVAFEHWTKLSAKIVANRCA